MSKSTTNASNNESRSWRELVSTHRLAMAVLAGILATHIATITGYWYHGIGMPDLDWPRFNGYLLERQSRGHRRISCSARRASARSSNGRFSVPTIW